MYYEAAPILCSISPCESEKEGWQGNSRLRAEKYIVWFSHVYFVKINTGEKEREERYV